MDPAEEPQPPSQSKESVRHSVRRPSSMPEWLRDPRLRTGIDQRPRVDAQVKPLRAAGAEKVWRETASGAKTGHARLRRVLGQLDAGWRVSAWLRRASSAICRHAGAKGAGARGGEAEANLKWDISGSTGCVWQKIMISNKEFNLTLIIRWHAGARG
jgi:hypothetical protein